MYCNQYVSVPTASQSQLLQNSSPVDQPTVSDPGDSALRSSSDDGKLYTIKH